MDLNFLILSPWEGDWDENVIGPPHNYYLLNEFKKRNVNVDWVYIGEKKYENFENIHFINVKEFKIKKTYNLIIGFSYQFHSLAREISRSQKIPYINKHFGIGINPLIWNIKNPIIAFRYRKLLSCFKKQADYYVIEEDGTNGKIMIMLFKIPSYKVRINEQPKPDIIKFEPIYRKENYVNVGYCGTISKYKGEKIILRIFQEILKNNKIHLIVLMKGENKILQELSKNYKNLTIIKNVPYFENYKFYSSIDFLVNPVHYGNMTLPTIEAFTYSKPVIAFDISLWTKIIHLKNGILVKPYDIKEFSNWVFELSNNKLLLNELSRNAYETSKSIKSFSEYIKEEFEFLKSICL